MKKSKKDPFNPKNRIQLWLDLWEEMRPLEEELIRLTNKFKDLDDKLMNILIEPTSARLHQLQDICDRAWNQMPLKEKKKALSLLP